MRKILFNKKYKGIKMHKYVPLLEKEVGEQIDKKNNWIEASLEIKEGLEKSKKEIRKLVIFLFIIVATLGINMLLIIKQMIGA